MTTKCSYVAAYLLSLGCDIKVRKTKLSNKMRLKRGIYSQWTFDIDDVKPNHRRAIDMGSASMNIFQMKTYRKKLKKLVDEV